MCSFGAEWRSIIALNEHLTLFSSCARLWQVPYFPWPLYWQVIGVGVYSYEFVTPITCSSTPEIKKTITTTTPKQKGVPMWTEVSKRLPDERINPNTQDYEFVLCATTLGDVRAYQFGIGHFWHGCGEVDRYVTHWQSFPRMPQE